MQVQAMLLMGARTAVGARTVYKPGVDHLVMEWCTRACLAVSTWRDSRWSEERSDAHMKSATGVWEGA